MTELKQFKLPDVGEGLTEADIVKWHVRPGDSVKVNQIIVEIETAKAVVELPSPFEGMVAGLLVAEGQTVDVGTPIISVDVSGDAGEAVTDQPDAERLPQAAPPGTGDSGPQAASAADLVPSPPAEGAVEPRVHGSPAPKQERQPVLVGYGVKLGTTARRPRKPGVAGSGSAQAPSPSSTPPSVQPPSGAATTQRSVPAPAQPTGAGAVAGPTSAPTVTSPLPAPAAGQPIPGRWMPEVPAAAPGASAAATSPAATSPAATSPGATSPGATSRVTVLAKPPVRKLAKELGVDLATVAGTGLSGSITRADVQGAADAASAAAAGAAVLAWPALPSAAGQGEERIPVRGVRKHTAAAVAASAFTAPHVTEFLQVDVTATIEATRRIRDLPEFAGLRPSPLLFVAKALLLAVARHPMINSSWDEQAAEIVVKRYVNLGIAAATERGLIVPNIKHAHALPLPALAGALAALAETARAGKSTLADMQGGTITITNVGVFGVDTGTPILTPGEAAILAFGQIRDMPWVHEGELVVRRVCTLSLSFDHRIVDGDLGSAVLREVGAMLEDPLRMLAWS